MLLHLSKNADCSQFYCVQQGHHETHVSFIYLSQKDINKLSCDNSHVQNSNPKHCEFIIYVPLSSDPPHAFKSPLMNMYSHIHSYN